MNRMYRATSIASSLSASFVPVGPYIRAILIISAKSAPLSDPKYDKRFAVERYRPVLICFFQRCQCSLFCLDFDVPSQRGVRVIPGASLGRDAFALCVPGGFLRLLVPGNGRAPGGARAVYRLVRGLPSACRGGALCRRAPGGFVRSSPSDLSPPLHRSWCGLIYCCCHLGRFGWFDIANIQHLEYVCQVFMQLFL